MLYKETVGQSTLELLKTLQKKDYLFGFHLVGGTALALRIGHRKSIDIDLFSNFDFDSLRILENLSVDFGFNLYFSAKNTLTGSINQVKVDILAHRYPLIKKPDVIEGISMLSFEDIIAMKLNAVTVSGQRVKDFIDIYYLLDIYGINEMIEFYKKKYTQHSEINVLKSLCWFEDVDLADWPVLTNNQGLKWTDVKQKITHATRLYLKNL